MNTTAGPALLDVRNVSRRFHARNGKGTVTAVDGISLRIGADKPSIVAVAGESGSGKSTLAAMLLGFLPPSEGSVEYAGADLASLGRAAAARFRREVQAIFQDPFDAFNPFYTVEHALELAIGSFRLADGAAARRELIENSLRSVRLDPAATIGRHPHQLSGGQLQRIMIARALMARPRLIVADEPVSMIDASLRAIVLDIMAQLRDRHCISQIYITHDLSSALQISDRILVLYRGMVVEHGDAETVIGTPKHPYTQLLVHSIPIPDPDQKWEGVLSDNAAAEIAGGAVASGCPFADRCPHVMDVCLKHRPPEFQVAAEQAAACFLYDPKQTSRGNEPS